MVDAGRLVRDVEAVPAARVLRGDPGRAAVGMAGQRLDAAQREHEAPCRIAPVGAKREVAGDVERGGHLACGADANPFAQVGAHQRVVHQQQRLAQRCPDVVHEFHRCRTRAAFAAIDDDEIRRDAGLEHRLGDAEEFPGMTDGQLEPGGLAARQFAQPLDELQHLDGRRERRVTCGRDAVLAFAHSARRGDFRSDLGAGKHAAMTGLRTLRELEFDHPDLGQRRAAHELLFAEATVEVAAAEVTGTDVPDQVAAGLQVIGRYRALAGVVIETAAPRTGVQGADRARRDGPVAHRRDVEHAGCERLRARPADRHAEIMAGDVGGSERRVDPFVVGRVDVAQRTEGPLVRRVLGALVDHRALLPRERRGIGVRFNEILSEFRACRFEEIAQVREQRIDASQRAAGLQQVEDAQHREAAEYGQPGPPSSAPKVHGEAEQPSGHHQGERQEAQGGVGVHGPEPSIPVYSPRRLLQDSNLQCSWKRAAQ